MYQICEEYRQIGIEVMKEIPELQHLQSADCRIEFLACDKPKSSNGKATLGECIKVQELYKCFAPFDFFIVFYDKNLQGMTVDQLKILMEHELLHVGYEYDNDGNPKYFVRPHDYDDFKQITDKYTTDWAKTT